VSESRPDSPGTQGRPSPGQTLRPRRRPRRPPPPRRTRTGSVKVLRISRTQAPGQRRTIGYVAAGLALLVVISVAVISKKGGDPAVDQQVVSDPQLVFSRCRNHPPPNPSRAGLDGVVDRRPARAGAGDSTWPSWRRPSSSGQRGRPAEAGRDDRRGSSDHHRRTGYARPHGAGPAETRRVPRNVAPRTPTHSRKAGSPPVVTVHARRAGFHGSSTGGGTVFVACTSCTRG